MQSSRLNAVVPAKRVVVLADIHRVRAFGPTVVAALQTDSSSSSVASGICRPGDGERGRQPRRRRPRLLQDDHPQPRRVVPCLNALNEVRDPGAELHLPGKCA